MKEEKNEIGGCDGSGGGTTLQKYYYAHDSGVYVVLMSDATSSHEDVISIRDGSIHYKFSLSYAVKRALKEVLRRETQDNPNNL